MEPKSRTNRSLGHHKAVELRDLKPKVLMSMFSQPSRGDE